MAKDVPEAELERAKAAAVSSVLMNLESRAVVAEDIGRQVLTYGHRWVRCQPATAPRRAARLTAAGNWADSCSAVVGRSALPQTAGWHGGAPGQRACQPCTASCPILYCRLLLVLPAGSLWPSL